ncbi:hypothetical protein B0O80DRAFT_493621 [Mortierella sp. GBAus27b]|nr:hypothetical protein B0O80DRAFT_493621 [Mortierella sp. GBAus27b]
MGEDRGRSRSPTSSSRGRKDNHHDDKDAPKRYGNDRRDARRHSKSRSPSLVAVVPDQDQNQGRDRGHALLDRNLVVTATTKETIPNPGTVAPVQGNQSPVVIVAAGAEAGAGIVLRIAALVAVVRATVRQRKHKRSRSRSRSKKSKSKRHRRRSHSSSDDSDGNPRSAITGQKLKLKIAKSSEDKKRDKNRGSLLEFLNASYD